MKTFIIIVLMALGISQESVAGVLIEPTLGYELGQTNRQSQTELYTLGARIAYQHANLWVGLESNGSVRGSTIPNMGPQEDLAKFSVILVGGMELPYSFRTWVGYGISEEFSHTEINLSQKGHSWKVGLGYAVLPHLSLNCEYIHYDTGLDASSENNTNDTLSIFASLPFRF